MRSKATVAICLILSLSLASTFLFSNSAEATVTGTFHFRAYIDGTDHVLIQNAGGRVWYEHSEWDYPGEHSPYSAASPAATTIDGVEWYPTWDRTAKQSNTYTSSSPQDYPDGAWTALEISKVSNASDSDQSRGSVTLEQYPSSDNSYTAKVLLDDGSTLLYQGAAWYQFNLTWEASALAQISGGGDNTMLLVGIGVVALLVVIGAAVMVTRKRK